MEGHSLASEVGSGPGPIVFNVVKVLNIPDVVTSSCFFPTPVEVLLPLAHGEILWLAHKVNLLIVIIELGRVHLLIVC